MEANTLIQLLNFSKTLIQDGEFHFLYYVKYPTHPDDVGSEHQNMRAMWEKQLRENPPKSENPEALRKTILGYLEREKEYGAFRGTDEDIGAFLEAHVVFQVLPGNSKLKLPFAYRVAHISRFENYPSLGHLRFFNGGRERNLFSNGSQILVDGIPNQFANDRRRGNLVLNKELYEFTVVTATYLPPSNPIDETRAEVHLSKTDMGKTVYIITDYPFENVKVKVYVRLKNGLPEVFREEYYYRSDSPHADTEGYWLRQIKMYRDFERVETLNIAFPKVREEQEFRAIDRFMRARTILTITEMDFNLGLPQNFFDWNEAELNTDDGFRKHINDSPMKITGAYEPHEETK